MDNIDLVYLWVDGNDPQWQTKRNAFVKTADGKTEETCKGRYADNDELKYSLRSAEKHIPWIRRIFIVTDSQTPGWLDVSNPKVKIIDHKDILPQASLPCFNASVIEYFLYKIPDLAEQFLYANDDMFFNADLQPDFFYAKDGFPVVRLKKYPFDNLIYHIRHLIGKKPGYYRTAIYEAALLVKNIFRKYYSGAPHHNVDAYKKSDYKKAIEDVFKAQVEISFSNHTRTKGELQRSAILYYVLAIGHGHLKHVNNRESLRIPAQVDDFMKKLLSRKPKLFCLNDSQRVSDEDRKRIKPFLEELFPEKSTFEKL